MSLSITPNPSGRHWRWSRYTSILGVDHVKTGLLQRHPHWAFYNACRTYQPVACTVLQVKPGYHLTSLLQQPCWLRLRFCFLYRLCTLTYSIHIGQCLSCLSDMVGNCKHHKHLVQEHNKLHATLAKYKVWQAGFRLCWSCSIEFITAWTTICLNCGSFCTSAKYSLYYVGLWTNLLSDSFNTSLFWCSVIGTLHIADDDDKDAGRIV